MLSITKIFHFEMAHAIHEHESACQHIHGHSYKLFVTVASGKGDDYIDGLGFVMDFKVLKEIINETVIRQLDHKLVLSRTFVACNQSLLPLENLQIWDVEPSVENLLVFARKAINEKLPEGIQLVSLKLYETDSSYAEWKI